MRRYLLYKGERTVKVSLLSDVSPFLPDCPLSFGLGGFLLWLKLSADKEHNQVHGGVYRYHSHQPILHPLRHHLVSVFAFLS